jgi:energy-coupling factor transport system permease protein
MAFEYVPGDSFFHRLDPRTKVLFFLLVTALIVAIYDPVIMLCVLGLIALMYKLSGIPFSKLLGITKTLLPVFVMFLVLNYFIVPPQGAKVYFYLLPGIAPVTMETTLIGITSALRFILFIWLSRLLTLTTSVSEILIAMIKMGSPPEVATSLGIAFSSVPLMINQFSTVIEAQKSRGSQIEVRNPIRKAISFIPVVVPGIYLTILRGMNVARTVESRAFTYNPKKRTFRKKIMFRVNDYVFLAVSTLATAAVIAVRILYRWFDYTFILRDVLKLL